MSDVSTKAGNEVLLEERREIQLDQVLKETRVFSRRAELPEDRIALAEIERELIELRKRWTEAGRINQEEPAHA